VPDLSPAPRYKTCGLCCPALHPRLLPTASQDQDRLPPPSGSASSPPFLWAKAPLPASQEQSALCRVLYKGAGGQLGIPGVAGGVTGGTCVGEPGSPGALSLAVERGCQETAQ